MSKPAPMSQKKRKLEDGMKGKIQKPRKKIRKQKAYHSSSEDEEDQDTGFTPVNLQDSEDETQAVKPIQKSKKQPKKTPKRQPEPEPEVSDEASDATGASDNDSADSASDADSQTSNPTSKRKTSKRNDPEAFSTSITKILSTKLSQSARKDPVLSRSREAAITSSTLANDRLEARAKAKMRTERKEDLARGRIKDVLGLSTGDTGKVAEEEKKLRKIAQRGVVKLFNAVRAAQVRGEQAAREERKKGTVGMGNREEKATEMSKQGFLELIGAKPKDSVAGEA